MKKLKCENNHFYDGDKYAVCPHCKAILIEENNPKKEKKESSGWRMFRKKTSSDEIEHTVLLSVQDKKSSETEISECSKEPDISNSNDLRKNNTEQPYLERAKPAEEQARERERNNGQSLLEQVEQVTKSSEPKTVGMWGSNINKEPVVGWLVCVQGSNQGESFELKAGKNSIGRSAMMDVIIEKDTKISRDKHSVLMYDPKSKKYFMLPNEGTGMVYKNDEILMMPTELYANDILTIGDSRLLFVPLCGERFTWDEWIES